MQEAAGINFDRIVQKPELHTWQISLAILLFACLIYGAIRWSRARAKSDRESSLRL